MNFAKYIAVTAMSLLTAMSALAQNSLTYQGVTFNTWAVDSDTLGFSILNATNATGDWAGINYLTAFEIKDIGTVGSASIASGSGSFTVNVDNGLAASLGCTTGNTNGACFASPSAFALNNSMSWTIDFTPVTGSTLSFTDPHLKVQFLTSSDGGKTGSLLSQTLPVSPVPEPETYAMLLAGLGLMGAVVKRRKV